MGDDSRTKQGHNLQRFDGRLKRSLPFHIGAPFYVDRFEGAEPEVSWSPSQRPRRTSPDVVAACTQHVITRNGNSDGIGRVHRPQCGMEAGILARAETLTTPKTTNPCRNERAAQILHARQMFFNCRTRIRELASTHLNLVLKSQFHTLLYDTAILGGFERVPSGRSGHIS
jgi:hypothetical protein